MELLYDQTNCIRLESTPGNHRNHHLGFWDLVKPISAAPSGTNASRGAYLAGGGRFEECNRSGAVIDPFLRIVVQR